VGHQADGQGRHRADRAGEGAFRTGANGLCGSGGCLER